MAGLKNTLHMALFRAIGLCICFAVIAGPPAGPAHSATDRFATFVTPFPQDGTYTVYVFGDALATGLFRGLKKGFQTTGNVRVINKAESRSSLVRPKSIDWVDNMANIVRAETFEIAVLNFGVNDRKTVRIDRVRYGPGTPKWNKFYGQRVDRLLKAAKAKRAAIYWVGLPVMRSPKSNGDAQAMNAIARERVFRHGGKFIDTWDGFTDGAGNFSGYGPDVTGEIRQLRSKDGIFFTKGGYRKLAHFVERAIRRDIAVARSERSIPLVGGEEEQQQLRRLSASGNPNSKPRVGQTVAAKRNTGVGAVSGEHGAAHSMIRVKKGSRSSEAFQVRILRPSIPAAVVAHIQRQSRSARGQTIGRNLLKFEPDGTGILNSVVAGGSQGPGRDPRVPITQTPVYKALVKGEALEPKPGRADDFSWPPQNRPPVPAGS